LGNFKTHNYILTSSEESGEFYCIVAFYSPGIYFRYITDLDINSAKLNTN